MINRIHAIIRTCPLITDKHLRLVITPKIKVKGQAVQSGEHGQTNGQMDGRTLPSTLSPCFTVDKYDDYPKE